VGDVVKQIKKRLELQVSKQVRVRVGYVDIDLETQNPAEKKSRRGKKNRAGQMASKAYEHGGKIMWTSFGSTTLIHGEGSGGHVN